jgi:lysine N6-hydroxylase
MSSDSQRVLDCVGVGIGPSNLSLACLLQPFSQSSLRLLDQRCAFAWHEGLLLPDATIQVSFLKDLVLPVDPTSRFSFLSYLHRHKRFYHFLNARFAAVTRPEFNDYLQWICRELDNLEFSQRVVSIDFDGRFVVETEQKRYFSHNLSLGVGLAPAIPACAEGKLCDTVLHASRYLQLAERSAGKRVVVVGGGQSGAEVFLDLITRSRDDAPLACAWLSRRYNFSPLDDTPFTNEFFTPGYAEYFRQLPAAARREQLAEQKFASDGISPETLTKLYQAVYENRYRRARPAEISLRPGTELVQLVRSGSKWHLLIKHTATGLPALVETDLVVLATGYSYRVPQFLEPISPRLSMDGDEVVLNEDFSATWDGPAWNRIYMHNAGRAQWGIADPNLSLIAWRSAKIINSLLRRNVYDVDDDLPLVDWRSEPEVPLGAQVRA